MNISAAHSGMLGLQRANAGMQQAAQNIVSHTGPGLDLDQMTNSIVELKQHELLFAASGKVIEASNATAGSIIDIMA